MPALRSLLVGTAVASAASITLVAPAGATPPGAARPATAASCTSIIGGTTTVETTTAVFYDTMQAGVLPFVISPGIAGSTQKPSYKDTFPIVGGHLGCADGTTIVHRGGFDFEKGDFDLILRNFRITLGSSPQLTAEVPAAKARAAIFSLDLSQASTTHHGGTVTLSGVRLILTGGAAKALDETLRTEVFAPGLLFGTATVTAHTA